MFTTWEHVSVASRVHTTNAPYAYDVVVGADVVASLYDPIALAEMIHALCHGGPIVFVSYKEKLTGPHEQFQAALFPRGTDTTHGQPKQTSTSLDSKSKWQAAEID